MRERAGWVGWVERGGTWWERSTKFGGAQSLTSVGWLELTSHPPVFEANHRLVTDSAALNLLQCCPQQSALVGLDPHWAAIPESSLLGPLFGPRSKKRPKLIFLPNKLRRLSTVNLSNSEQRFTPPLIIIPCLTSKSFCRYYWCQRGNIARPVTRSFRSIPFLTIWKIPTDILSSAP